MFQYVTGPPRRHGPGHFRLMRLWLPSYEELQQPDLLDNELDFPDGQ